MNTRCNSTWHVTVTMYQTRSILKRNIYIQKTSNSRCWKYKLYKTWGIFNLKFVIKMIKLIWYFRYSWKVYLVYCLGACIFRGDPHWFETIRMPFELICSVFKCYDYTNGFSPIESSHLNWRLITLLNTPMTFICLGKHNKIKS